MKAGRVFGAAGAFLGFAMAALGAEVPPGQTVELAGVTPAQAPWFGKEWSPQTDSRSIDVSFNPGFYSGIVTADAVVLPPASNAVVWYSVFTLSSIGVGNVVAITIEGLGGQTVYAEYRPDLGAVGAPERAIRSADGDALRFEIQSFGQGAPSAPVYVYSTGSGLARGRAILTFSSGATAVVEDVLIPAPADAPCAGDINGDGAVNFADLNGVLSNFGQACE